MNPELRALAIETLGQLKIAKRRAAELVDAVSGATEAELVRNALRRAQALKEGQLPLPPEPICQARAPQMEMPQAERKARVGLRIKAMKQPAGKPVEQAEEKPYQAPCAPVALPRVSAVERLTRSTPVLPLIDFALLPEKPASRPVRPVVSGTWWRRLLE